MTTQQAPLSGDDYQPQHSDQGDEPDIITEELTDDPVEELGVPASELARELDRLDGNDPDIGDDGDQDEDADDMREFIEDADQDSAMKDEQN